MNWNGPGMVASALFKSLLNYSTSIDFIFYTYRESEIQHERIKPLSEVRLADVHHVLNGKQLALELAYNPDVQRLIIGTNVIFDFPQLVLPLEKDVTPETWQIIQLEEAICRSKIDCILFPSMPSKSLIENRLFGKRIEVLPSGIDLELFFPRNNKPKRDFLIIIKSDKKEQEGPLISSEFSKEVASILSKNYDIEVIREYNHNTFPTLLQDFKVTIHTTPYETQGIAIMEAMACGKPAVCVDTLPYKDPSLDIYAPYYPESFATAAKNALVNFEKIGDRSFKFIRDNFSLVNMSRNYHRLLIRLFTPKT